jgi:rsbT co-antagonist protein RsbR
VLDADPTARFRSRLAQRREEITSRWRDAVGVALRGRPGEAELGRQIEELVNALHATCERLDVQAPEAAELRAVLAEPSRSRARLDPLWTKVPASPVSSGR